MAKLKGCGPALPDDLVFALLLRVVSVVDLCKYKCVSKSWRAIITNPAFFKARTKGCDQVAALPGDLVFEVLKRVKRVEDLCQYKCVSKSWRSIITDPRFFEARQTRSPYPSGGIVKSFVVYSDICKEMEKELIGPVPAPVVIEYWYSTPLRVGLRQPINQTLKNNKCSLRIKVPASNYFRGCTELVNGLTCVYEANKQVFVCNVCTGQTLRLPDNEFDHISLSDSYSTRCFLGYIPGSRVYKLLKLSIVHTDFAFTEDQVPTISPHGRYSHGMQAEILTLGSDSSWRKLDDGGALSIITNQRQYSPISFPFVLVDGGMFWDMRASDDLHPKLITFDLNTEKFRLIRPPQHLLEFAKFTRPPCLKLVQFRGRPALYRDKVHSVAEVEARIIFYVLLDDEGYFWSNHTPLFACPNFGPLRSPRSRWHLIPFGNRPTTGQILFMLFVLHWDNLRTCFFDHIYSYDPHKDKFERFFVGGTGYPPPPDHYLSVDYEEIHYCKWGWLEENYASLEDLLNLK